MLREFAAVLWDVDLEQFDLERHAPFLVRRVLERGTWDEWLRLRELLGLPRIESIVRALPRLDPRALAFCSAVFRRPREDFACFHAASSAQAPWIS